MNQLISLAVWSKRIARNALLDLRYGGLLSLDIGRSYEQQSDTARGLFCYWNSDFAALSQIFKGRISSDDVLVDVGCGKGRVINWWLDQGFTNPIIGLELEEKVAEQTRRRLRKYKNVKIITGDAVENIPHNGTIFYLYNPFPEPVLEEFKKRLLNTIDQGSDLTIYYYNCKHSAVFQHDPQWQVSFETLEGASSRPFQRLAIIKRLHNDD